MHDGIRLGIDRNFLTIRRSWGLAIAIANAVAMPGAAAASGNIPPIPIPPETYPSFAACKLHLESLYAEDMKGVSDGVVKQADGTTRQKQVTTEGVQQTGSLTATYQARVGFENRAIDASLSVIVTNFSYEDKYFACKNGNMTGTRGQGFYSPGVEQIKN